MGYIGTLLSIMVSAILTNNIVLNQSIGICPFLGVSKKTSSAIGMGLAVTFVITLSSLISYLLYEYVLVKLGYEYLKLLLFILVIASLVQTIEIILKKFSPVLYNAMGIYLPLITTNCSVLATANAVVVPGAFANIAEVLIYSVSIGLGFLLALLLMAGVREKLERCSIPKPFQGFPIALLTAGIISLAFMGLAGMFA